jgi:hypothetical protein
MTPGFGCCHWNCDILSHLDILSGLPLLPGPWYHFPGTISLALVPLARNLLRRSPVPAHRRYQGIRVWWDQYISRGGGLVS